MSALNAVSDKFASLDTDFKPRRTQRLLIFILFSPCSPCSPWLISKLKPAQNINTAKDPTMDKYQ